MVTQILVKICHRSLAHQKPSTFGWIDNGGALVAQASTALLPPRSSVSRNALRIKMNCLNLIVVDPRSMPCKLVIKEGGVKVCSDAVLRFFWCSCAVIFILTSGIAVSKH